MHIDQIQDIDIILHLHLPKCAGTSLRTSVFQALPENKCVEWNSSNPYDLNISKNEFATTLEENPNARFISGHFPYGIHTVLKGKTYKYMTVLRNPINCILSGFRHTVMENMYLLPAEEAGLIVNGGFDAYIRSEVCRNHIFKYSGQTHQRSDFKQAIVLRLIARLLDCMPGYNFTRFHACRHPVKVIGISCPAKRCSFSAFRTSAH